MSPSTEQRENREFASETKFLVPRPLHEKIRDWARARLSPDPHASSDLGDGYRITSLYFDTEKFDVFHRKGSYGRSKYRIRRYGPSETAFLERKLKTRGLVSKRRSVVKLDELERLANREPNRDWPGFWYHQRLLARRLAPVCEIAYRRTALVSMTGLGPIRLTLDEDIRAMAVNRLAFNGAHEGHLLSDNHIILELKYRLEMPAPFKELLAEFQLKPQPISKYRLAAVALGLVKEIAEGNSPEIIRIDGHQFPGVDFPAHEPTSSPRPGGEPATGASNETPLLGGAGGGFMGARRDKRSGNSVPQPPGLKRGSQLGT